MKIHVHIDRLVLDGLPIHGHSAPIIREAVEAELGRLLMESRPESAAAGGAAIANVRTPAIHIPPTAAPGPIGRSVAQAIHGGMPQ